MKEPWEMTREYIIETHRINEGLLAKATGESVTESPPLSPGLKKDLAIHRELVEKALSEGKLVPVEVLADYPELRKAKITGRKGGIATEWRYGNVTITFEAMKRKAAGLGGKRYVARIGQNEYAALTKEAVIKWIDEQESQNL